MTTITATQLLAFRCAKCFQTRCSTVDRAGQQVACELCGHENTVPEATAERIAQGENFLRESTSVTADQMVCSEPSVQMSDYEIMQHCRQQTIAKSGLKGLVCSKTQRFLGALIDGFVMVLAFIVSFMIVAAIFPSPKQGAEPNPAAIAVMFGIPLTLALIQMVLTATEGRTIGKYCMNAKIVNDKGEPPGFVRGVLLRQFVNALLALIPFYGLVDVLAIFTNDSHRCLHDYVAGTHVIHGN